MGFNLISRFTHDLISKQFPNVVFFLFIQAEMHSNQSFIIKSSSFYEHFFAFFPLADVKIDNKTHWNMNECIKFNWFSDTESRNKPHKQKTKARNVINKLFIN